MLQSFYIRQQTKQRENVNRPMMWLSHGESGSWNESFSDERHSGEASHSGNFLAVLDCFICNTVHNIQLFHTYNEILLKFSTLKTK